MFIMRQVFGSQGNLEMLAETESAESLLVAVQYSETTFPFVSCKTLVWRDDIAVRLLIISFVSTLYTLQ